MKSRAFVVLFISMLVAMAGVGMVTPLLPIYVRDELGGPAAAVALSFSGLAIAQIITSPFTGTLGDRFGLKWFIVGGFAIYCLGAVGYLFADRWELVVGFRILSGFGAAGVFPMTLAYVGQLAPPGREGRYMGAFTVSQVTGFGLGPLLGGGVRDAFGAPVAFASMAAMLGGTALLTLFLLPANPGARAGGPTVTPKALPWGEMVRRRAVQGSVLFMTILSFSWGAAFSFLAIFVVSKDGLGIDSVLFAGVLLSSRQLTNAALQPVTGGFADRYDRILLVGVGLVLMALSTTLIPLVPGTTIDLGPMLFAPWVFSAILLAGIGEALAMPAQQAVFVRLGRSVGMGSLMGLSNTGQAAGLLAGSLAGASVVAEFGLHSVFYFAGGMMLLGMMLYVVVMRGATDELALADREANALASA